MGGEMLYELFNTKRVTWHERKLKRCVSSCVNLVSSWMKQHTKLPKKKLSLNSFFTCMCDIEMLSKLSCSKLFFIPRVYCLILFWCAFKWKNFTRIFLLITSLTTVTTMKSDIINEINLKHNIFFVVDPEEPKVHFRWTLWWDCDKFNVERDEQNWLCLSDRSWNL